ncbi:MAG: CoA-binding protein [Deltaproteobacteria bacterium]|nr:CoA-binding protein [Deltaproteobacteria bacterium]
MKMSSRNLGKFFNPKSIAVVGVSSKGFNFGGSSYLSRILECGYRGRLYPINPKADEIMGVKVYPSLEALPEVPDLAIVSLAAKRIPDLLETCARIGLRHIHLLTAGFKEIGTGEGAALEAQVVDISRRNDLMVIGPNCMGVYCPPSGLTLYGASPGIAGPLGIISQSGGITQRITEYACSLNMGIDKAVSFGNAAVLDACDYLEYFAADEKIKIIAMYLENVRDGRRLLNLAKAITPQKPIVMLMGGRSEAGAKTVASHTGAMAGSHAAWDAFFNQAGVTRVETLEDWMDAILALGLLPEPTGKGLFIGSGGGGKCVIAGDTAVTEGLVVPELSKATWTTLREKIVDVGSIVGNPLDSFPTWVPDHLADVLQLIDQEPACAMVLIDHLIPRKIYHIQDGQYPDTIPAVIECLNSKTNPKPTVVSLDFDGGDPDLAAKGAEIRHRFCKAGIPAYPSVRRAARALMHLYRYHQYKRKENCTCE